MPESTYLRYLPPALRDQGSGTGDEFTGRFLLAFERLLSGLQGEPDDMPKSLEGILDRVQDYFDPNLTPPQFIDWLASWVALELRQEEDWLQADFGETTQTPNQVIPFDVAGARDTRNRSLIKNIANLYRIRGTRAGLEQFIAIYAGSANVSIREFTDPMQVGVTSVVGDTTIVGERPYYFQITITIPEPSAQLLVEYVRAVRAILDREKPAHTYYDLFVDVPTMQVGVTSTVGVNTMLGGLIQR